jgi:hypothetical protein
MAFPTMVGVVGTKVPSGGRAGDPPAAKGEAFQGPYRPAPLSWAAAPIGPQAGSALVGRADDPTGDPTGLGDLAVMSLRRW